MCETGTDWCSVCGTVEGRVPHVEEEVGNLAGCRLQRAKEYVLAHADNSDSATVPWEVTSEAITHIQQLRNRELGIGYLAQVDDRNDQCVGTDTEQVDGSDSDDIQMVCEWCKLPKFGENRCICDSPKFSRMAVCEECGNYEDIDKIREADGTYVCPDCEPEVLYN